MKTLLLSLTCTALLAGAFVTPALAATTGQQAVDLCRKTNNCIVSMGQGGDVLILGPAGGTVTCPSLTANCTAHARTKTTGAAHLQSHAPTVTSIILQ